MREGKSTFAVADGQKFYDVYSVAVCYTDTFAKRYRSKGRSSLMSRGSWVPIQRLFGGNGDDLIFGHLDAVAYGSADTDTDVVFGNTGNDTPS